MYFICTFNSTLCFDFHSIQFIKSCLNVSRWWLSSTTICSWPSQHRNHSAEAVLLAVNRTSTALHRCDEASPVFSRSGMRWEKDVLDYAGVFFSVQIRWQTLHTQLWLNVRHTTNAKSAIYKQSVFILSPALAVLPPCWRYPPRWRQSGSLQTDEYCAIKNSR